jgi:hypothetical protein
MIDDLELNLLASHYENVFFPLVDEFETATGHHSTKHRYRRRRGVDNEWTGEKAETYTFKIAFLNDLDGGGLWPDDLYPTTYNAFRRKVRSTPIGIFGHPEDGPVRVIIDDVKRVLNPTQRNGVIVSVTMTEQGGDAAVAEDAVAAPTSDPSTRATTSAASADAARPPATSQPAPLTPVVTTALTDLERERRTFGEVQAITGNVIAECRTRLVHPSVTGIAGHDYRVSVERVIAEMYRLRAERTDTTQPRTFTVAVAMSVGSIAALADVYGDPTRAQLLLDANRIADASRVPVGTILSIPPVR